MLRNLKSSRPSTFQVIAVLAVTCSAVVAFTKFDNAFTYTHESLRLALGILMWLALFVGLIRPDQLAFLQWFCVLGLSSSVAFSLFQMRTNHFQFSVPKIIKLVYSWTRSGVRSRSVWYGLRWIVGTARVILIYYNIYTRLHAYMVMRGMRLQTLQTLFSIRLGFIGLMYLPQDRRMLYCSRSRIFDDWDRNVQLSKLWQVWVKYRTRSVSILIRLFFANELVWLRFI